MMRILPFFQSTGSPPLTRELLDKISLEALQIRITPAYAGTTIFCTFFYAIIWDHPRLRGNYELANGKEGDGTGSPPLTRELPTSNGYVVNHFGITPAYAGTTK